jgi:hypothetical protein
LNPWEWRPFQMSADRRWIEITCHGFGLENQAKSVRTSLYQSTIICDASGKSFDLPVSMYCFRDSPVEVSVWCHALSSCLDVRLKALKIRLRTRAEVFPKQYIGLDRWGDVADASRNRWFIKHLEQQLRHDFSNVHWQSVPRGPRAKHLRATFTLEMWP